MTVMDACGLMEKYAQCPKCGCTSVGKGKGSMSVDTEKGRFSRTCTCGWGIFITDDGKGENDGKM